MNDPFPVPPAVLEGVEAVRPSGRSNMLDRPSVERHQGEYAREVFHGFRAEPETAGDTDA